MNNRSVYEENQEVKNVLHVIKAFCNHSFCINCPFCGNNGWCKIKISENSPNLWHGKIMGEKEEVK